ncbi:hypothetical protein [Pseudomonas sp. SLFW]|uniref:hypothetical protein n=1 Tax=Pseudomonas sp. SLFW TaxID=2683259 RepID=UPI001412F09E|nr:hypothetical protein [Pseudomonas sp. SLFW]NBB09434.1 hypothetical protein [Pseudomonas sp. SLFW]
MTGSFEFRAASCQLVGGAAFSCTSPLEFRSCISGSHEPQAASCKPIGAAAFSCSLQLETRGCF